MDKYEFDIKIEQIKKMMKKKDFAAAVKLADTIEWRKVKENQLLIMAADVYEIAGMYDSAREALLLAYEKTGLGRQLAYRLCRLSVKRGDFTEAQEFYEEFIENSPRDAGRYILQYEMAKGKGEAIEKRIEILETFIEADMDDRWAYELAKLYHRAHMSEKCVELCDTIILWFADGKYVEKALELKQLYVPLSENQRLKYETQKSRKSAVPIMTESEDVVADMTTDTVDLQAAIINEKPEDAQTLSEEMAAEEIKEYQDGDVLDVVHEEDIDVNSIHVKDFSVNNKYDTMNIQKELAQSVSVMFDKTMEIFKPVAPKAQEEETVEDDQIEGQMSLDEVLAMFESGELQTKDESEQKQIEPNATQQGEESEATKKPKKVPNLMETMEIIIGKADESFQSLEDFFPEEVVEEINQEVEEETQIESKEEVSEELTMEAAEEIFDDNSEAIEDETDEVSQLAEIVAEDIQENIEEDIDEEIQEEAEKNEAAMEEYGEEAESEEQETNPIMYDLKEEIEEAQDDNSQEEENITENSEEVMPEKPVKSGEKQSDIAKRELKNFISKFTGVQGLDKQILKVMQSILKTDTEPVKFIFVKGEVKSGKTTLAVEVIKLANKIIQRRDQKLAKIKGLNINEKSVDSLIKILDGSDVLVERVSDVQPELFAELIDKLKEEGKPRVVIFEDEKSLADDFLANVPEGYGDFANVIDIKVNKIKDWAKMAEEYAKSQGYVIDEIGTLALSAKIDQLRAITLVVHKNHIEQLIDGAITKANKFSLRNLFGKKKTEEGYRVLTEKNFMD